MKGLCFSIRHLQMGSFLSGVRGFSSIFDVLTAPMTKKHTGKPSMRVKIKLYISLN